MNFAAANDAANVAAKVAAKAAANCPANAATKVPANISANMAANLRFCRGKKDVLKITYKQAKRMPQRIFPPGLDNKVTKNR